MSAGSPAASFLLLCALLEEKKPTIADPVFITSAYSESYCFDRTLDVAKRPDRPSGQEIVSILEAHLNSVSKPSDQHIPVLQTSGQQQPQRKRTRADSGKNTQEETVILKSRKCLVLFISLWKLVKIISVGKDRTLTEMKKMMLRIKDQQFP